ncbi:unnamed protein product [Chrysoparadoxa australica]
MSAASFSVPTVSPLVTDFVDWLNTSWTAYHAVAESKKRLLDAGYVELREDEPFAGKVSKGGRYFFTRNMSAIVAFAVGGAYEEGNGVTIIGAHTDSPCPKLKPASKCSKSGCLLLSTNPYGGGLWHTWFDRDLTIAGRVIVKRGDTYSHDLVRINRPVCRIPTLAIHLTAADERNKFSPNLQNNFYPVLASEIMSQLNKPVAAETTEGEKKDQEGSLHHPMLLALLASELGCSAADIEDFELQLCDTQPSVVGGALNEFIYSGRLDNLCSSWQALRALIDSTSGDGDSLASESNIRMIALFDHEEIGSTSAHGAASTLLPEALSRTAYALSSNHGPELMEMVRRRSFVVSADMAHSLHPNYADKHDPQLGPLMHKGMVVKHNANQRYATNAVTAFIFREVGRLAGIATQEFAVKSDSGCGSTIGPMISALSGIRTVDVGSPQWSMHSCREVMGTTDVELGYNHLKAVFENFPKVDAKLKVDGGGK